jgi:hypothetical protein
MISRHPLRTQIVLLLIVCPAFADQTVPPKRVPLPDLGKLNLDFDVKAFQNKTALICSGAYHSTEPTCSTQCAGSAHPNRSAKTRAVKGMA